jgi:hypothetical protein
VRLYTSADIFLGILRMLERIRLCLFKYGERPDIDKKYSSQALKFLFGAIYSYERSLPFRFKMI